MTTYARAINSTVATTTAAALEIIAGAASFKLIEISIRTFAATASRYGLGIPAAVGITPTSPVPLLNEQDPTSAITSPTTMAVAWGTGPTAPAAFFKRGNLAAVAGSELVWTFPQGLLIPAAKSLVLWNLTANSADIEVNVRTAA